MYDKDYLIVCNEDTRRSLRFQELHDTVFLIDESMEIDACVLIDRKDFEELLEKGDVYERVEDVPLCFF